MTEAKTKSPHGPISKPQPSMPLFPRIVERILAVGRSMLERPWAERRDPTSLAERCTRLLTHRGSASGLALAEEIISIYEDYSQTELDEFFGLLSRDFRIVPSDVLAAADRYREDSTLETVTELRRSLDAPFKRLLRRLNTAPGGTMAIVGMRQKLLERAPSHPELAWLETDIRQLLIEWFNRGFLALHRVDWDSPARVLEKIIEYEAVHEINGWDDLRNRLRGDRRCFAFFHLVTPDDPVIFLQVALTDGLPATVGALLDTTRDILDEHSADTAVFYSISNCHKGLNGISFGDFLIKRVVELLRQEFESIRHFVTLSPLPGFRRWLEAAETGSLPTSVRGDVGLARERLADKDQLSKEDAGSDELESALTRLAAHYLAEVRRADGQPLDGVARFHLANGASIARLCWAADVSEAGMRRSWGVMVNYAYHPRDIERNHENYYRAHEIAMSDSVRKLARGR
jgi:malonyl-CoA decarboxylase